jgi:hypothetical protein
MIESWNNTDLITNFVLACIPKPRAWARAQGCHGPVLRQERNVMCATNRLIDVIIIPGGVQMCGKSLGTLRGSQTWDGAILKHGNGRYGYYKNLVFRSKIEKCKQFSPATAFGLRWDFPPRGSRPDKIKPPPGADLSISPSGVYYDI